MAKKQFKAESKRLLELMINSIYTNKEIFLRELISNASDALDKRYYLSLTDKDHKVDRKSLQIRIERHPENRTLVIEDTGIGMTQEELEKNLGTIARSGSAEFREQLEKATRNIDIIGQFGVGFYSAFMVAKKITVESRSALGEEAWTWVSSGEDGYTITPGERQTAGTRITLELKDDTEDEKYSSYLDEYKIRDLVRKYSDYVRYPIVMDVVKTETDPEDKDKTVVHTETETLNSMVPLWKKNRSKIQPEEYNEFYKSKFNDWQDPRKVIHYSVEGNLSYTALLFIPAEAPYNFYNTDFEPGLQLYSKGVFILDKARDLLPDAYRFVTGLIDSDDISLNISREILQQDRQVKALASSIEKKIHGALLDMLKNERESYEKFFESFGRNLKYAIYKSYGMEKDKLQDLLMYRSSHDGNYVTLKEYRDRMPEEQKEIYFASGRTIEEIEQTPGFSKIKDKGYEILYFMDDMDEFVITMMNDYDSKPFKSIAKADLDLDTEEEKQEKEKKAEENKDMLQAMQDILKDNVKAVRISSRLTDDPVCLVSDEGLSIEMEKILAQQDPAGRGMKAEKILEINQDHPTFATLQNVYKNSPEELKEYTDVLYDQALLIEGLPLEDPAAYARKIVNMMIQAADRK
ncbi:MAG: molecular chaperone HtpG [Solobacterium sp.]|nr:molecular chaperone HtpG [Solobacterium sp.]